MVLFQGEAVHVVRELIVVSRPFSQKSGAKVLYPVPSARPVATSLSHTPSSPLRTLADLATPNGPVHTGYHGHFHPGELLSR